MQGEDRERIKRLEELAIRAETRGCRTYSEFLTPAEQETLCALRGAAPVSLEGGYPDAERRLAVFGPEAEPGEALPVCWLCIAPVSQKFAEELTHRDVLGALMCIGIRRAVLGDIVLSDNRAWLFCLDTIADYIAQQLAQVRRTPVTVTRADAPQGGAELPALRTIVVASARADAVVAAVYKLPRAESQQLFVGKKVFLDGRLTQNTSAALPAETMVSVRGFGRFRYEGIETETRKGRLRAHVRVY